MADKTVFMQGPGGPVSVRVKDNGDGSWSLAANPNVMPAASLVYRTAVVVPDVVSLPGAVTCTKQAGGSAVAGVYTTFVVAGNKYGRTLAKQGDATIATETTNLTVRAAFVQVAGAEYYDIYCSVDGAAAKWVGRITEAQRASGILITAVGVTGAGGVAGAVDIQVPGTGLAVNGGQLAVNTAYIIPGATVIDCRGYQFLDLDLSFSRTGDAVLPVLTVVPFWYDEANGNYFAGTPVALTFGGGAGNYQPLLQRVQIEARGRKVHLIVETIAGTGGSLDINYGLS